MDKEQEIEKSASTEEKIKEAARRVFTRKGYAATRTRDIAEESGYNLALINYYFRSKEKLFDIIIIEQLQVFVHSIKELLNDRDTSLPEKLKTLVGHYIDMIIKNPDLPMFILREVNADPKKLAEKVRFEQGGRDLYIVTQWQEMAAMRAGMKVNPLHIMLNVISMTVFPFVASPLFRDRTGLSIEQFNALMEERKQLIPLWINAIMNSMLAPEIAVSDSKK